MLVSTQVETLADRKLDPPVAAEVFAEIDWAEQPEFIPRPIVLKAGIPREVWAIVMVYAKLR
jgi:hypothetical protein